MPADLYNPKHFLEPSTLTLSDNSIEPDIILSTLR
jgi:hypothetical protein